MMMMRNWTMIAAALLLAACPDGGAPQGDAGSIAIDAGPARNLMEGAPCAVQPSEGDLDGDMIDDIVERRTGTNPTHPDSDGDGIVDGCEDFDRDGVVDPGEMNPREIDTDGDCISDGDEDKDGDGEIQDGETDPVGTDSDGDHITDGLEDSNCNGIFEDRETDPLDTDTDDDGFDDGAEDSNYNGMRDARETDPRFADTDRDGLSDSIEDSDGNREVNPGETDPLNPDSDGDGVFDGAEDLNANGEQDEGELDPGDVDSDDDGIIDGLEDRNGNGIYDVPGDGEEFSGETDGLNPDTDGDGLIDGLDEDRNGNGQVDQGENNPRLVDVNEGSPQVQICATRHLTPIELWDSPRLHVRMALPEAVYASRRELSTGAGLAAGLAFADVADGKDVHAFLISRSPNDQVAHSAGGRRSFTQAQQDVLSITGAGFTVAPGSPRVFTTADDYEAAVVALSIAAPGLSALQVRNQIAAALSPGLSGFPQPGGEAQSGNYKMVISEIFRSNAQVITLFAIAPATDDRELEGQRGIASDDLAGGSNLAGDNAEIARHCGSSPISRSSSVDFLWIVDNSGSMRAEQDAVIAAARSMVAELDRANLDWRLAVTTTDGSGTIIGGGFTDNGEEFIQRVNVGTTGSANEVGLASGRAAIANLLPRSIDNALKLRFETPLVIVILSDEEDADIKRAGCLNNRACAEQNMVEHIEFYRGETDTYRAPVGFNLPGPIFSIINLPNFGCQGQEGHSYDLLAIETGGRSESICGRNGNVDYTELMADIAQTAAGIASDYPIQERPIATTFKAGIQHEEDTVRLLARSRRNGFDYDVTQNRLIIYGNQETVDGDQLWASFRYWLPPRCMIDGCPGGQECNKEEDRCE
jgi:hypothetical protein